MLIANSHIESEEHKKTIFNFENEYIKLRRKEERLYTNEQVKHLPDIEASHIHSNEWKIRKRSSERLVNYLKKKNKNLNILEVGCGNGWLSAKMAEIKNTKVTGLDINKSELMQAEAVFSYNHTLRFIYGDIRDDIIVNSCFDIIVFAASIQYFPSLKKILAGALSLLNTEGEIHILDTNFYRPAEIKAAIERTANYYQQLGHPEMKNYYFHHSVKELASFKYKILFNPFSIKNKFNSKKTPFYWFCIKN